MLSTMRLNLFYQVPRNSLLSWSPALSRRSQKKRENAEGKKEREHIPLLQTELCSWVAKTIYSNIQTVYGKVVPVLN
jgi:hypothetical protein